MLSAPHLLEGTLSSTGAALTAITILDVNGDGLNDLAISYADGRVAIFLGQGDDVFSRPITTGPARIPPPSPPSTSMAMASLTSRSPTRTATILRSCTATATVPSSPAGTVPAGYSPRALAVADFNGDGVPDLATANFATNDVSILLGDGHGGFRPAGVYAAGSGPVSLVTADFNEDGAPDLAVLNQIDGSVSVLLNDGSGVFRNKTSIRGVSAVEAGDVDGDGHVDLLLHAGDEIQVRRGVGDGTFVEGYRFRTGASPLLLALQRDIAAMDETV